MTRPKEEVLDDYLQYLRAGHEPEFVEPRRAAVLARMAGPGEVVVPREPTLDMWAAGCLAAVKPASEQDIRLALEVAKRIAVHLPHGASLAELAAGFASMRPALLAMYAARPKKGEDNDQAG